MVEKKEPLVMILDAIETIATKKELMKGGAYVFAYYYAIGLIDMAERSGIVSEELATMLRELAQERRKGKDDVLSKS